MKILVAIPTYDRRIDIELVKTLLYIERSGTHYLDYIFPVSSHISRNRNMACIEFLKSDYEALLFLDSDIGILDETFIDKMIETAYKFNAKIVGGAYRMKKPNEEIIYVAGQFKDTKMDNIKKYISKPMEVETVGTGIMLIFKEVIQKLKDPWFTIVDKPNLEVMPEDFEFCRKAKENGFVIALDSRFETHHFGQWSWTHSG